MATKHYVDDAFAHLLDTRYSGYPDTKTVHDSANNPVDMPVAPFQYFNSHDHSQLIAFFGTLPGNVPFGDRSKAYKLQPFAIALLTCAGTPMLWQGQEFADNYVLPDAGNGRICYRRDVHWEYYFDEFGAPLVRLYQILVAFGTPTLRCAVMNAITTMFNLEQRMVLSPTADNPPRSSKSPSLSSISRCATIHLIPLSRNWNVPRDD